MFSYYLQLALRSLKRNQALTALMVLIIGFGVAASMTTWSVFRAVSGDPIPQKSAQLFVPSIDNWGPQARDDGNPPDAMDYTDAVNLMCAQRALPVGAVPHFALDRAHAARPAPVLRRWSCRVR